MNTRLSKHPFLLLFFVFALGCAAHAATTAVAVAAQSRPEVGIYRECIAVQFVRGHWIDADDLSEGELPSSTARVPDGWHVAGGGGGNFPNMILCR